MQAGGVPSENPRNARAGSWAQFWAVSCTVDGANDQIRRQDRQLGQINQQTKNRRQLADGLKD